MRPVPVVQEALGFGAVHGWCRVGLERQGAVSYAVPGRASAHAAGRCTVGVAAVG
ncbi:hypothetical protein OG512_02080 [Streptomyces sp. NBC_01378]|uniref:hypothetical protein n=1 Tax=Streptomyces sp. NBC_01378 TaxID=2903844 RepID=UPI0032459429